MNRLEVTDDLAGQRLDVFLAAQLGVPRSRAAARIDAGDVRIGAEVVARSRRVRAGEVVEIAAPAPRVAPPPPPLPPIRYRDEHLLVVAKPAGLVVHPGAGHPDGTLVDALRAADIPLAAGSEDHRPGIVHRLDRDTSGLLLVACTQPAFRGLTAALAARRVARRYLAVVAGIPAQARGRIEAPIGRDPRERTRFAVVSEGKPATTRYRTLSTVQVAAVAAGQQAEIAALACQLGTGRTHQLRVHLAALGTPILGDLTYGAPAALARALGLDRPFLHAAALGVDHPVTGERIELFEPLPAELRAVLQRAGLPEPGAQQLRADGVEDADR